MPPGERTMKRFRAREEPDLVPIEELMKRAEMRRPAPGLLRQKAVLTSMPELAPAEFGFRAGWLLGPF